MLFWCALMWSDICIGINNLKTDTICSVNHYLIKAILGLVLIYYFLRIVPSKTEVHAEP